MFTQSSVEFWQWWFYPYTFSFLISTVIYLYPCTDIYRHWREVKYALCFYQYIGIFGCNEWKFCNCGQCCISVMQFCFFWKFQAWLFFWGTSCRCQGMMTKISRTFECLPSGSSSIFDCVYRLKLWLCILIVILLVKQGINVFVWLTILAK